MNKKVIWGIVILLVLVLIGWFTFKAHASVQEGFQPITLCHATGSKSNPYVQITVDNQGAIDGHEKHKDDIIPPNDDGAPAKNWTTQGQAIWENDCKDPKPTPTPTAKPTATPTPKICNSDHPCVTPTPKDCDKRDKDDCEPTPTPTPKICYGQDGEIQVPIPCPTATPTPSEEPTPSATPSATPTPTNDGGNGGGGQANNPPVCSNGDTIQLPANPFVVRKGDTATVNSFITQGDSENIYWGLSSDINWFKENSSAGTNPNGVFPNADHFVSYTIGGLNPNLAYNFGIQQKWGCGGGNWVTAVIVDGASYNPITWDFSYWMWSK